MDKEFSLIAGSAALDQSIEFRAYSVVVDNPTNQWVSLNSLGVFVPQYTLGATYPLPGTTRAQVSFTAPAGQQEPPIIAAQAASVRFFDLVLPLTAGVGMLGGRAAYYDRTPVIQANTFRAAAVAPHVQVDRWTYTVPSGKRAFIQQCQASLIRDNASGAPGLAVIAFTLTPLGGVLGNIISADATTGALGDGQAIALGNIGLVSAGDILTGRTQDASVGGTFVLQVSALVVEFDA